MAEEQDEIKEKNSSTWKEEDDEPSPVVSATSTFDEQEFQEIVAAAKANIAAEGDDLTPLQTSSEEFEDAKEPPASFPETSSSEGSLDMPLKKKPAERSDIGSPWTLASEQADDSKRSQSSSPWETVEAAPTPSDAGPKKPPPLPPSMNVAHKHEDDSASSSIGSGSMTGAQKEIAETTKVEKEGADAADEALNVGNGDEGDVKEKHVISEKETKGEHDGEEQDAKKETSPPFSPGRPPTGESSEANSEEPSSPKASTEDVHESDRPESPPVPEEKKSIDLLTFDEPGPLSPATCSLIGPAPVQATPPTLDLLSDFVTTPVTALSPQQSAVMDIFDFDERAGTSAPNAPPAKERPKLGEENILGASQQAVDSLFAETKPSEDIQASESAEENPWLVSPEQSMISATQSTDEAAPQGVPTEPVNPPSPVNEEQGESQSMDEAAHYEVAAPESMIQSPREKKDQVENVMSAETEEEAEAHVASLSIQPPQVKQQQQLASPQQAEEHTENKAHAPEPVSPPPPVEEEPVNPFDEKHPVSPAHEPMSQSSPVEAIRANPFEQEYDEQQQASSAQTSPTTYLGPIGASQAASPPGPSASSTAEEATVPTTSLQSAGSSFEPVRKAEMKERQMFFPEDRSAESADERNRLRYTSMEDEESGAGSQLRSLPQASLMAKTRSRAAVDLVTVDTTSTTSGLTSQHNFTALDDDDNAFIINTAIAKKRVRVVQLLIIGLLGIALGFFGSLYVLSTCHFVAAEVPVGQNHELFELHYGFWKYSPIESAFDGYSYCMQYDDTYTGYAPLVSRIGSVTAIVFGTFALTVLWYYLISGRAKLGYWKWSVRLLVLAGCMQALTFFFFFDDLCRYHTCNLGPGAAVSIAITVGWFLLAYEMHVHTPVSALVQELNPDGPGVNMVANLEATDFKESAKSYMSRLMGKNDAPSLNQIQRMRGGTPRSTVELELASKAGSMAGYRPPVIV